MKKKFLNEDRFITTKHFGHAVSTLYTVKLNYNELLIIKRQSCIKKNLGLILLIYLIFHIDGTL